MTINLEALRAPFRPDEVSWRVGPTTGDKTRGIALAYIDARVVQDRLDEVCGITGWQNRYTQADTKTVCEIGIRIGNEWLWRADGAGDSDMEAAKGALSDAFKRAAVRWGIGRYLYDLDSPWVEIEKRGNSYVIKDSEKSKLARILMTHRPAAEPVPRMAYLTAARDRINAATTRADIGAVLDAAQSEGERLGLTEEDHQTLRNLGNTRRIALQASPGFTRDAARVNGHAAAN